MLCYIHDMFSRMNYTYIRSYTCIVLPDTLTNSPVYEVVLCYCVTIYTHVYIYTHVPIHMYVIAPSANCYPHANYYNIILTLQVIFGVTTTVIFVPLTIPICSWLGTLIDLWDSISQQEVCYMKTKKDGELF